MIKVKNFSELQETEAVKKAIEMAVGMSEPSADLKKYMDNIGTLYKKDLSYIEKVLAVATAWQNYYSELKGTVYTIRAVALAQLNRVYSLSMSEGTGTLNDRREAAKSSPEYTKAEEVYMLCDNRYIMLETLFDNCDRLYKTASRVGAIRIGER